MPISILNDLRRVLGISQIFNSDASTWRTADLQLGNIGTVSFANLLGSEGSFLQNAPARIYSLDFYVSAAAGDARWSLIDATASSAAGTAFGSAVYTFIPVAVGAFGEDFIRPLNFTKGIVIAYTATAGSFSRQIYYGAI